MPMHPRPSAETVNPCEPSARISIWLLQGFLACREHAEDRVHVKHAPLPCSAAGILKGGPETGFVGQGGIGREIRSRRAPSQYPGAGFGSNGRAVFSNEVYRAFELPPIDDDLDEIAVAQLPNRPAS